MLVNFPFIKQVSSGSQGGGWFEKATDKNEELAAAVPDIIVENPVDYNATNDDDQLKVAMEELLKQLPKK